VATERVRVRKPMRGPGRSVQLTTRRMGSAAVVIAQLAVLLAVVGGLTWVRATAGGPVSPPPAAISPTDAASAIAAALEPGGLGISFTIVQHTTVHARPGGPLIAVADPADPRKVVGQTDTASQASCIERGGVSSDGFWMELRDGPVGDAAPDFANGPYEFGAIVKAGKTYRSEGVGWYETLEPPGIGIDPATAVLLPQLVRHIANPTDLAPASIDGKTIRTLGASASIADIPGLMAVDAASFSELTGPIEYGFDDAGRLVRLHAVVRNTRIEEWDYLVDVVIAFGYGDAGPIPDPSPALRPSGSQG